MRNIAIACVIGLLFTAGCQDEMDYLEKGSASAQRKVLIAGTASEFKQDVVDRVIESLGTEDYYFRVIGLDRLKREDTGKYGAIILVARFAAAKLDRRVSRFLEEDPNNPKVIVFYTIGSEEAGVQDWAKPDIKVDTVTSASLPARVKERADELSALIEARFSKP